MTNPILARRSFEMAVASGYSLLRIVRKGDDVTAKDLLKEGAILGGALTAIYYQDKIVRYVVNRGWLTGITRGIVGVQLAYVGGAVAATYLDPEDGFQNYNEFIDLAIDNPGEAARATGQNLQLLTIVGITEAQKYVEREAPGWEAKLEEFFGGIPLQLA